MCAGVHVTPVISLLYNSGRELYTDGAPSLQASLLKGYELKNVRHALRQTRREAGTPGCDALEGFGGTPACCRREGGLTCYGREGGGMTCYRREGGI